MQALANLYGQLINRPINPVHEVLVTAGAYEALYSAIHGHINEGDKVAIIEPCFESYRPLVESAGGVCKCIPLIPMLVNM